MTNITAAATLVQAEEVEDWLKSDGRHLHPAYGEDTHWLTDEKRFAPGATPPILKLKKLLVLYQGPSNLTTSSATPIFDPDKCSWDDVLAQLELAKAGCLAGNKHAGHKADRFLAKAASYSEKWLDLLPDDYGLSIVRGGLALVFSAAATKIENRERIIQAFDNIPDMIRTMETACRVFGSDAEEDINTTAKAFYDGLCSDIPDLIQLLDGKMPRLKRVLNRFAAGAPETQKIDDILERIQTRSSKLESKTERIKMRLDAKERSEIFAILQNTEAMRVAAGGIYSQVAEIPKRQEWDMFAQTFGQTLVTAIGQKIDQSVQKLLQEQNRGDFAAEAQTYVFKMIQEIEMLRNENATLTAQKRQIEYDRSRQPSPLPGHCLSSFDLIRVLGVDPNHPIEDLGLVLKKSSRMDSNETGRARWLMRTTKFQMWIKNPHHHLLMADGAMRPEKISPMSIFTATMATSLLQVPAAVVLQFFCGKNLDSDVEDGTPGPQGMLRSLISQLLLHFTPPSPNLSAISSTDFVGELQHWNFSALSEVLRILITQVPPSTTLYMLLDGISYYEQGQWLPELQYFVGLLRYIMSSTGSPCLKILLTNSGRSTEIRDMLNLEWEYVSLAAGNIDHMPLVSPSVFEAMSPGHVSWPWF
ncbi:hypothetical protein F5Y18DRAFT_394486 [Xylariaceae sp. FL1019]|nr:hypothetical protein F5Y18DRAFT_394486 [Xylariaceae sp. FL1019]